MKFKYIIFYLCSILGNIDIVMANGLATDTLNVKSGECKQIEISPENQSTLIWTTGNQDIAVPEVTFGNLKICALAEGTTYISGRSFDSDSILKIFVKVIKNDSAQEKPLTKVHTKYQSSIDKDVGNILDKIIPKKANDETRSQLEVSDNNRYLVYEKDNKPFIFLSQTLWSITRRLSREEIIQVLDISSNQGFTAIQLIAHAHYMGPNIYGKEPFENENFLRPQLTPGSSPVITDEYDWWDHLEFIIDQCIKREMFVCLLPTWREQWNQKKNLNENNALAYGKFIGTRYRSFNPWIIWVMGGDEAPNTPQKLNIHRELAKGISIGINGTENYDGIMMTYHTHGPTSTVDFIPAEEKFMDFNTIQSGHSLDNLEGMMQKSYRARKKPVLDFEPLYTKDGNNRNETRAIIYWGIFEGGFGTSYGSWNIWHCGAKESFPKFKIPESFYEGFGTQIKYLGELLKSNPFTSRIPNQKILVDNDTKALDRIVACSSSDHSYAMVYSPNGNSFTVSLSCIKSRKISCYWFNPRNGDYHEFETINNKKQNREFTPPTTGKRFSGNDWVLVLKNK